MMSRMHTCQPDSMMLSRELEVFQVWHPVDQICQVFVSLSLEKREVLCPRTF